MTREHAPRKRGRERVGSDGCDRLSRVPRIGLLILLGFLVSACAATGPTAGSRLQRLPPPPSGPERFEVGRDTFAFPNLVRSHDPGRHVAFANYCIIMARSANQFFRFARFALAEPRVSPEEYTRLAREVMAIGPWVAPWPDDRRVVIPGYPDLYAFSRAEEAAIKAAFGSHVLSLLHWRTWRVALQLSPEHQERVAVELVDAVRAGRPAPLMITNYPDPDILNHAVLVYDYRVHSGVIEFLAYDPNDPGTPLGLHFDRKTRSFWVEPLPYSPPGRIRAFRLYTSPLL